MTASQNGLKGTKDIFMSISNELFSEIRITAMPLSLTPTTGVDRP